MEDPVNCVSVNEKEQELNQIKNGRAPGPSEASLELIAVSMDV